MPVSVLDDVGEFVELLVAVLEREGVLEKVVVGEKEGVGRSF